MAEEIKNRFCDPEAERGLLGIAIQEPQEYLRKTAALPEDTDWQNMNPGAFEGIDLAGKVGYLAELRNVKFSALVRPGDTLELHAIKKIQMGLLSQVEVFARVGGRKVVEGVITVSQKP